MSKATDKFASVLQTFGDELTRPLKSAVIGSLILIGLVKRMIVLSVLLFAGGVACVHFGQPKYAVGTFSLLALFSVGASLSLVVKAGKFSLTLAGMTLLIDKLDGEKDIKVIELLKQARAAIGGLVWYVFGCLLIAALPLRAWTNIALVAIVLVAAGMMLLSVLAGWWDGGNGKWLPMWATIVILVGFVVTVTMPGVGSLGSAVLNKGSEKAQSAADWINGGTTQRTSNDTANDNAPQAEPTAQPTDTADQPPPEPSPADADKPAPENVEFIKNADCGASGMTTTERLACLKSHQTWTATTMVNTRPAGGYGPHQVPTANFDPNDVEKD